MKLITGIFISVVLFIPSAKAVMTTEVLATPFYGYGVVNFLGGGSVPTFNGHYFGFEGEYKFVGEKLSFGVTGSVLQGSYENDANTSANEETLDLTGHRFGLKLYYHNVYFKLGYGFVDLENTSTGTTNNVLTMDGDVVSFGVGYNYSVSKYIRLNIGFDTEYARIDPSDSGVTARADYYNYGASIGFQIVIPSNAYIDPTAK